MQDTKLKGKNTSANSSENYNYENANQLIADPTSNLLEELKSAKYIRKQKYFTDDMEVISNIYENPELLKDCENASI